jgi:hypothetical protein
MRRWLSSPHSGGREILGLALLYALYEVVRGFGSEDFAAAFAHTDGIVALERSLGVFWEQQVQAAAEAVPAAPAILGLAYVVLHFAGTAAAMVWVHRRRRNAFPIVRTTFIFSTALALVGYVLYPAAPPRLTENLGFADTVSSSTGLNLSSDLLGSLYNPIAAVPSLHFGYALIVGVAIAWLARTRTMRWIGASYPVAMLLIIVATGNHFFFDAFAGGIVVVAGYRMARVLVRERDARPATVAVPA